jgi:hypothetical protein
MFLRGLIDGTSAGDCRKRCQGGFFLFFPLFASSGPYFPPLTCRFHCFPLFFQLGTAEWILFKVHQPFSLMVCILTVDSLCYNILPQSHHYHHQQQRIKHRTMRNQKRASTMTSLGRGSVCFFLFIPFFAITNIVLDTYL